MLRLAALAALAVPLLAPPPAQAAGAPIPIVAAENFYGDVAQQIGGPDVTVHSILTNPDQDPHLFEVSPSVGRNVSAARIVIYSGIDYDPWMEKLLQAARIGRSPDHRRGRPGRPEDRRQSAYLVRPGDHAGAGEGARRGAGRRRSRRTAPDTSSAWSASWRRCSRSRRRSPRCGNAWPARRSPRPSRCSATCSRALGMQVRNMPFQMAVMNNTEPGASDVAAFEKDLQDAPGEAAGL